VSGGRSSQGDVAGALTPLGTATLRQVRGQSDPGEPSAVRRRLVPGCLRLLARGIDQHLLPRPVEQSCALLGPYRH